MENIHVVVNHVLGKISYYYKEFKSHWTLLYDVIVLIINHKSESAMNVIIEVEHFLNKEDRDEMRAYLQACIDADKELSQN